MSRDVSNYDDRAELTEYLWRNYFELFSTDERLAAKRLLAEQKIASPEMSEMMRLAMQRTWMSRSNAEVDTLLARGPHEFRVSAAMRIVEDCTDQVLISRCPSCNRIVATPLAKQCLWCGYDWHEETEPN